jgi:TonB family protein
MKAFKSIKQVDMKRNTLKGCLTTLFIAAGLSAVTMACNNDKDETVNNSTVVDTTTTINGNDTMSRSGDTSSTTRPGDTTTARRTTTMARKPKVSLNPPSIDRSVAMKTDDRGYYNYTETSPVYQGGQSSLENYIANNIEYPQDAIDNEVEGTVYVNFTIDENGKVGNVKTTGNKLGYGMEEAATQVVSRMSNWTPGMNKGKKVKAWYTLPITFKLEE